MVVFFCNSKIFPSGTDPLSIDKEEGLKKEKTCGNGKLRKVASWLPHQGVQAQILVGQER